METLTHKVCSSCQCDLPLDAFRRRWKDRPERHSQCRRCNSTEARERRKAKRQGRVYEYAQGIIDARRDRNRVTRLTHDLFTEFGSSASVAAEFKRLYDDARAAGRHMTASKLLLALPHLLVIAHELEAEERREFSQLTDAELEDLVEQERPARLAREAAATPDSGAH